MPSVVTIDPVTRLEGHLRVDVTIEPVSGRQQVVDARVCGTLFRGFESMLAGREPSEAPHLTQRICGVCSVPHGVAAATALEKAAAGRITENARLLRNLVMGANFIQSHILHFYHLSLLDYISGPAMSPWEPQWDVDRRIGADDTTRLMEHYRAALKAVRQANEMAAVFAGRQPHSPALVPGGFTNVPKDEQITTFRNYCGLLKSFVQNFYSDDVDFVVSQYPEYSRLGRGYGNLLAFGGFCLDSEGERQFMAGGRIVDDVEAVQPVDTAAISEHVGCSWYDTESSGRHPSDGATEAAYPKDGAYSWLKAPRYEGRPYETGPLARMAVSGIYKSGISVNDRHKARFVETLRIVEVLPEWLDQLKAGQSVYSAYSAPTDGDGVGLTEAPRGALGHWLSIRGGRIANYQVVTPTCWNGSPRDDDNQLGPMEKALIGTPVSDSQRPVEVLRVIHSFDPCLACAVHVCRPSAAAGSIVS